MSNKQGFRKNAIIFLIVLLFFSFILYFYFDGFYAFNGNKVFRDMHYNCFTYLEENTLYQDKADCYFPPLYYIFTKFIFDFFDKNFIFVMIFLALILNVILFMIIYNIIRKRGNSNIISFIIPLILYGFVAFVHMLDTLLIFGGIFFYLGFYFLFYSKNKYKEILAGVLFGICTLLYEYLFFMGGFLLFVYFMSKTFSIKFNKSYPDIKFSGVDYLMILKLIFPIVIIVLFFSILFPSFLNNSYLPQLQSLVGSESYAVGVVSSNNFIESFPNLFSFIFGSSSVMGWVEVIKILIVGLSLYFLMKRRDSLSLICFLFLFGFALVSDEFYKFALVFPLFIILFIEWMNEKSLKKIFFVLKWFFIVIIMVLLIYPNLKFIYLNHEFSDMAREVSYPLSYLPQQENILFSSNRLIWYGVDFEYEYDILHPILYDVPGAIHMQEYGNVNVSEWFKREYDKQYSFVVSNFDNYSLIMGDVRAEETNVIFNAALNIINNGSIGCFVILPSLEQKNPDGNYELPLLFKSKEQCDTFKNKVLNYYIKNLNYICEKDEYISNIIVNSIFYHNQVELDAICMNGGSLYYLYVDGKWNLTFDDVRIIYFLIIGISMILLGLYISFIKKSLKIIYFIVFIIILIFGINFLLSNYDMKYYHKLTQDEVTNKILERPELFGYGLCYYFQDNSPNVFSKTFCKIDQDCIVYKKNNLDLPLKCTYNDKHFKRVFN